MANPLERLRRRLKGDIPIREAFEKAEAKRLLEERRAVEKRIELEERMEARRKQFLKEGRERLEQFRARARFAALPAGEKLRLLAKPVQAPSAEIARGLVGLIKGSFPVASKEKKKSVGMDSTIVGRERDRSELRFGAKIRQEPLEPMFSGIDLGEMEKEFGIEQSGASLDFNNVDLELFPPEKKSKKKKDLADGLF